MSEFQEIPRPPVGKYSNYIKVGFNAHEFVIDFGQAYEEEGSVDYHTRVITSPAYMREMLITLGESLADYQESYGYLPNELDADAVDFYPDEGP